MEYRNAKYINSTQIDCEINSPTYGWIPFTCDPTDVGAGFDVTVLYESMSSDPNTLAYTEPTQEELDAQKAKHLREVRNSLLEDVVDRVVCNPLRWGGMTEEQQKLWETYRQALLDVPQQKDFPYNVVWPTKPE